MYTTDPVPQNDAVIDSMSTERATQTYLPDYNGPAVNDGRRPDIAQPDPQLAQSFLPDYKAPAQTGKDYANIPKFASEYANIPSQRPNPYGVPVDANSVENAVAVAADGVVQRPVTQAESARKRSGRALPPVPNVDVYTGDGVDRIVTEKRNGNDPHGLNDRSASRVPDRAQFQGRIVLEKASKVMVLRSTASDADKRSETLIHLPESASKQLRADADSRKLIDNSLTYGTDSKPLNISYDRGKWSVSQAQDTPKRAHG